MHMTPRRIVPTLALAGAFTGALSAPASACSWCRDAVRTAVQSETFRWDAFQVLLPSLALVLLALVVPSAVERWLDGDARGWWHARRTARRARRALGVGGGR
jgi:hypothetical protein